MGQFGWQMSGQPMIFPFVQYSLIHDLALNLQKKSGKSSSWQDNERFLGIFVKKDHKGTQGKWIEETI